MARARRYMVKSILTLLLCLACTFALGQHKLHRWHEPTKAETKLAEYNAQCVHHNKYSAAQRLKFYPFNKAVQVKLVAFYGLSDPNVQISIDSTAQKAQQRIKYWLYPFNGNQIDSTQFMEVKLLDKTQVNKLTDILYNIGERAPNTFPYPNYKCYEPRNAIVFINSRGKIFAYIEICFQCQRIRTVPENMKMGQFCDGKLALLKKYLADQGIVYGVDMTYTEKFPRVK
jgi:hypothetical protein